MWIEGVRLEYHCRSPCRGCIRHVRTSLMIMCMCPVIMCDDNMCMGNAHVVCRRMKSDGASVSCCWCA